jgi:hypothetical protein
MSAYVPPGWPSGVHPPGTEDFERTAQAWLLDTVPADYRLHGVLRRYPLALAAMAIHHTRACVTGAREGYRTARTELGAALPPHALDAVLAAYRAEGRRLVATARAVDLVARALRGEVFTPQLRDDSPPPGQSGARPGGQSGASSQTADAGSADELSARRSASRGAEGPAAERPTRDGAEGPAAERPMRDGAAKARKAPAAQRPARNGGAARRKTRSSDKQAAAR